MIKSLRLSHINQALVRQSEQQRRETEAANERLATAQVALADANQTLERRIELRTADLEHEVAERQRYAEALARLASTDPLTGLWNRTTFAERLACMLADADAGGTRLAVVFLDLDNFKQVNDVRGHTAGDQVLQTSAHLLSQAADDTVQLARWGGDEFVMAVPITRDSQSVVQMATSLRHVLMRPLNAGIDAVRIDATVGIAIFPEDGRTQDELIRAADVAMYEAKKEGKGRVKLFDPALARNVTERHRLEQALREAMARNEFSLAYQPIISTATGGCKAFEALLRWQHPELGSIGPSTFIPIAEQTGQIATIGRWVLIEACKAAASWPDQTLSVTVNASVAQAVSGMLLDDVEDALAQTGLSATRLEIEITESMFVSDHVRVAPIFEDLRRRGIRCPAGRFRHRVLVPGLSRQAAAGRDQDRPELRAHRGSRRLRDHPGDPLHCRRPRARGDRGRGGNRRPAGHANGNGGRQSARLPARASHARPRRRKLAAQPQCAPSTSLGNGGAGLTPSQLLPSPIAGRSSWARPLPRRLRRLRRHLRVKNEEDQKTRSRSLYAA